MDLSKTIVLVCMTLILASPLATATSISPHENSTITNGTAASEGYNNDTNPTTAQESPDHVNNSTTAQVGFNPVTGSTSVPQEFSEASNRISNMTQSPFDDGKEIKEISANWSPSGNMTIEECDCPDILVEKTCSCIERAGFIVSPRDMTGANIKVSYFIDIGEPANVIIYFTGDDVKLGSLCQLFIGDTILDETDIGTTFIETNTDTPIEVSGYIDYPSFCAYNLTYLAYPSRMNVTTISDMSGTITPPADDLGAFSYRPNTQMLWLLVPSTPTQEIHLDINMLDVGATSKSIHTESKASYATGDFLLVGTGEQLMGGSDLMLYGHRSENDVNTFNCRSDVCHIFFNSRSSAFNSSGFNITFESIEIEMTTTEIPFTTNPPAPEESATSTITSINGAPDDLVTINTTIKNFKESVANMSTTYLIKYLHESGREEITAKSVEVFQVMTCNEYYCSSTCVAFNFSVAAVYPNGSWIFYDNVLQDMIKKPDLQYALKNIAEDCEVCNENPTLNLWLYVPIPVAFVVFAVIVSAAMWVMGRKTDVEDAHQKYEQELADKRDDTRRRSSGNISILGLGGSIASRGSRNSRRFTMPFPKANRDEAIDEEDEDTYYDISSYREYDPDLGRIDPEQFGVGRELFSDRHSFATYGNPAFEDDEDKSSVLSSDSDDSDGALSFNIPMKKKNAMPTSSMQTMVDVHRPDETAIAVHGSSEETAL